MKTDHLNDQSIQRYIFDLDNCDISIVNHINSCNRCLEIADSYKLLFKDLKKQESPGLDFSIKTLVLNRIANRIEQKKLSKNYTFISAIALIAIGVFAIIISILKTELINQFDTNNFYIYIIICAGIFMTILLIIDSLRSFNIKMNKINLC